MGSFIGKKKKEEEEVCAAGNVSERAERKVQIAPVTGYWRGWRLGSNMSAAHAYIRPFSTRNTPPYIHPLKMAFRSV